MKKSIAEQIKALEPGETLILETKQQARTQRAVSAAASKTRFKIEQKGFFGVSANGDLESTGFLRITRT